MTESPSALLERAATLIEQRAEAFRTSQYWDREVRGADLSEAGAAWARLIGPPAAPPLVEWLRAATVMYRIAERQATGKAEAAVHARVGAADRAAFDFARQILGEHP